MGFLAGLFGALAILFLLGGFVVLIVSQSHAGKCWLTGYESGFSSYSCMSGFLSIRFFILVLVFLVLDVELGMFVVVPSLVGSLSAGVGFILVFCLWLYLLGTVYEWWLGGLSWVA